MKKRVFAFILFVFMLLPTQCLKVFAEQSGTAFPFSEFSDNYLWITSSYPSWEQDYVSRNKDNYEFQFHVPVSIHVNKYDYTKDGEELFNLFDSYLAQQTAEFYVYKTNGLWENMHSDTFPKVATYDIQFVTDHDDINRSTKSEQILDNWRKDAAKGLRERESGVREVISYGGGWLYQYSYTEFYANGDIGSRHASYSYMRPIPEIPGTYLIMSIGFSAVENHLHYENFSESEFQALVQKWTESLFNASYKIAWNDDYWDYTMTSKSQNNTEVTQSAQDTPGEDDGVDVPADIVDPDTKESGSKPDKVKTSSNNNDSDGSVGGAVAVGVLSLGAAAGAAASASGGGTGKGTSKGNQNKKSYKMYVQKDFGDAIRRGADPVKIRARMAEVDENGVSRDRNDLTALIGVSGDGMTIHDAALVGRYCEATVSVPENNDNDTANIIFTFNGEGGTFTNTVIFRLVDGPSLKFVEESETPGTFNLFTAVKYVDMIPGDGFTYVEQFMIVDATVPPAIKDMTADKVEGYDVRFEMTERQYVYKVIIKNNTPPLEEEQKELFAEPKQENLTFHVKVQGEKEPVDGYVTMFMYQEGITVASDQKAKKKGQTYVRIQAYEKENVGALDKKWQVSQMKFTLAVRGKDKAIINPTEAKYKFEKLKGAGGIGTTADKEDALAEKYKFIGTPCEINEKPGYQFEPQANLSEPTDGTFFMVLLPACVTYEHKEYQAELPLRLRGKDMDPMADWEKEFEDLKRRIEKFSLPENKDAWLARMESCALEPRVSVEELRLVSKCIIREYMTYWTIQGEHALSEARMYHVIVNGLEWTKFIGDCAFSFLVAAYAGPVAEALISPAKDFVTGAIGEVIAAKAHGEAVDVDNFEFSKNLAAAGDNLVSNNIKLTDWRKAAATLGGYFCYAAIKNYLTKLNEKGESDFYGALCEGFKDMTLAALKSKAGDLIGKWLKDSKKFQETIGPKIASYFKETNMDTLQKKLNDALGLEGELRKLAGYANDKVVQATVKDVVEKYIGNLVGAGFDKLRETYDKSKFGMEGTHVTYCFNIELFDAFSFGVKLDLTQILLNTNGMFFGWFYDLFFAGVPAASSVINAPKDPELPPIQA